MENTLLKKKKLVFVGLSGGVDSSVSAALLIKQGFDVVGVFIKVWQPDIKLTGGCSWREDRLDAMRVCSKLKIPFFTLDLEQEYKKEVADYMISEYKSGHTPNPDVMCNKYVKFGAFFDWAVKHGADFVATGHYTRISKFKNKYKLLKGNDKKKDQSYFLWTLTQRQLEKTLFPIGNLEKKEVRRLAKKFGLENANKKDSQGVCFIGKIEMIDFLKKYIKPKLGNVLNEKGENIGSHDGIYFFTLGQRHGFKIFKKTIKEKPYFIIQKSIKNNTLTVSHNPIDDKNLASCEVKIKKENWISGELPNVKKTYLARIRYRQPLEKCFLSVEKNKDIFIKFEMSQKTPTPGQSIVIYDGEVCLGGGIIK